jgi:hypothetical protein
VNRLVAPFRRLDRYLLLNAPRLWLFGLPYVVPAGAALVALAALWAGVYTPVSLARVPSVSPHVVAVSAAGLFGTAAWLWFFLRRRGHLPGHASQHWASHFLVLGCLALLNVPGFVACYLLQSRIRALESHDTLIKDALSIQILSSAGLGDWRVDEPVPRQRWNSLQDILFIRAAKVSVNGKIYDIPPYYKDSVNSSGRISCADLCMCINNVLDYGEMILRHDGAHGCTLPFAGRGAGLG